MGEFNMTEQQELIRTHGLRISEMIVGHSFSSRTIIERAERIIELAKLLPDLGARKTGG
jgi:hypothetical protein